MPATLMLRLPPWSPWRPRPDASPAAARPRPGVVVAVKVVHTLAWLSIESCVVYVLYAWFAGRTGRRAGIAGVIVAGETLVFAGNGFRCPLTGLGLIHAANQAREQGLAALPATISAPLIHDFRHGVPAGPSRIPRGPGRKQHPCRDLLECLRDRQGDVLRFVSDLRIPRTSSQA